MIPIRKVITLIQYIYCIIQSKSDNNESKNELKLASTSREETSSQGPINPQKGALFEKLIPLKICAPKQVANDTNKLFLARIFICLNSFINSCQVTSSFE